MDRGGSDAVLDYARGYSSMPRPLEQGAEFARVLEHSSPLGSSMLVCNTICLCKSCFSNTASIRARPGAET